MAALPEKVSLAFEARKGPIVLVTVDAQGMPNVIYASCVNKFGGDRIVVADNYFSKTRRNILSGSKGAVLFLTENQGSFQVKGTLEYHRSGEIFEDMKRWNPEKHPGHAALALKVEEVYAGSEKLL